MIDGDWWQSMMNFNYGVTQMDRLTKIGVKSLLQLKTFLNYNEISSKNVSSCHHLMMIKFFQEFFHDFYNFFIFQKSYYYQIQFMSRVSVSKNWCHGPTQRWCPVAKHNLARSNINDLRSDWTTGFTNNLGREATSLFCSVANQTIYRK